jgi:hypothetical protein
MRLKRSLLLAGLAFPALACPTAPGTPPDGGDRSDVPIPPPADCSPPEAGDVSLTSLDVQGAGELTPSFEPGIYDYYVRCASGYNALTVSTRASSAATVSLSIESPGGALKPSAAGAVNVADGQAIVATVTAGKASQPYWVRCLPPDFPEMQWTPHAVGCSRTPGYYLIGKMSQPSNVSGYAIVLDPNGVPVWYREGPGGGPVYDVETLTPGNISFSSSGWQVDRLEPWETTMPGGNECPGPYCGSPDEHELRVLPNGHYMGISSAAQSGVNLTGVTVPGLDGGVYSWGKDATIYACDLFEFDAEGKVYWTWRATDHFDPAKVWTYRSSHLVETQAEPFHCNAIDVDPANDNLLVSARHMDSIFYIEKSTKRVLWKMGGVDTSMDHDHATYVPVEDPFFRQHDARLLPGWNETCSGGSGQISLFDDETQILAGGSPVPARGTIYDVNIAGSCGSGGGTHGKTSATLVWQYKNWQGYQSDATGSMRVTESGTRIIDWGQPEGDGLTSPLLFTEVDEKGNDLLDLICPDGSSSYRAVKVPLGAFSLAALRNASGQ